MRRKSRMTFLLPIEVFFLGSSTPTHQPLLLPSLLPVPQPRSSVVLQAVWLALAWVFVFVEGSIEATEMVGKKR
jgi:hypothetical protein